MKAVIGPKAFTEMEAINVNFAAKTTMVLLRTIFSRMQTTPSFVLFCAMVCVFAGIATMVCTATLESPLCGNYNKSEAVYLTVARKALDGKWGKLTDWQRQGYEKLLRVTPIEKSAWITVYNENDPGCNFTTASGRRVSHRVAAMIDKPWATWVLVDLDTGYQLRQVFDTGSRKNIWRAQNPPRKRGKLTRQPAQTWIDLYYSPVQMRMLKNGRNQSWVRPIFIF